MSQIFITLKYKYILPMGLSHTLGSPNVGQKTRTYNNQQKKLLNCRLCCSSWRQNTTERMQKKKDKYFDFARELKKLWHMLVTTVPILISAFGTITKGLLKGQEDLEIGGGAETIQTTTLLRTARTLRKVLETCEVLLSRKLQWKTIR